MDQDLRAYLEQHLSAMEKRFFSAMEQRFGAMEQRFDGMEQRFSQELQDLRQEVHQVHIVVENIHDKIDLTVEGLMNVNEKLDRHREDVSGRFNDIESLMRTSDRAVASRVKGLEQKVKRAV
jgi:predicted  nucleic acid-binding Zn-ribbon protein